MKAEKKYHGVVIPLVTPFDQNGRLDEGAIVKLVESIVVCGSFPFILGTTGESASIPFETKIQLAKRVADFLNDRTIIYAGISDNCLENSLNLANRFFDLGIHIFVAHLPSYFPLTKEMMLRYYEILAERCPGEIMIYNIKSTTHMSIPLELIQQLSHHPKIIGLKDSERDLERLKKLIEMFADRQEFSLFCGWTDKSAYVLQMGFDGIVPSTGNLIPKKFCDLYDAVVQRDYTRANDIQREIDPVASLHQKDLLGSEMVAALKVMMNQLGLCQPWVLPPLTRLNPEREQQIKTEMTMLRIE